MSYSYVLLCPFCGYDASHDGTIENETEGTYVCRFCECQIDYFYADGQFKIFDFSIASHIFKKIQLACFEVSELFDISMNDASDLLRRFCTEAWFENDMHNLTKETYDNPEAFITEYYEILKGKGLYYKTTK